MYVCMYVCMHIYTYLFLERVEEREKERERNINQLPCVHALIGDRTHNLGMCPDQEIKLATFCFVE